MNDQHFFAKFWRCALQVNPVTYQHTYRGKDHGLNEDEYNNAILQKCIEREIKVVGIADHGNVDSTEGLRNLLKDHDIVVFPGFEISSNDKTHYVCLFPEDTTKQKLERLLGSLSLLDPEDGIRPSKLSSQQLIEEVDKLGGFIYAAHCTQENGLLKNRLDHIWKLPQLRAAQIPASIKDLQNSEDGFFYKQVLSNKVPAYKRDRQLALINAKDVAKPDDLDEENASCLVKMTRPTFSAFKVAFLDPESRVRLNSQTTKTPIGRILKVSVNGGYLDGLIANFSDHLNTIIGGRGTGKSTLLECIRYALNIQPKGSQACKIHKEIIYENLGKEAGQIEITIVSSSQNGRKYTISRAYNQEPIVRDDLGNVSELQPIDLLPNIEIYGQNEIFELARNENSKLILLSRFLLNSKEYKEKELNALRSIETNQNNLNSASSKYDDLIEELNKLPKLEEELNSFNQLGIKEKLSQSEFLARERQIVQDADSYLESLHTQLNEFRSGISSAYCEATNDNSELPDQEHINQIQTILVDLRSEILDLIKQTESLFHKAASQFQTQKENWERAIQEQEEELNKLISSIPSVAGRSGREIGTRYNSLIKEIESIKPKKDKLSQLQNRIDNLKQERRNLLADLLDLRNQEVGLLKNAAKSLNRKMNQKIKVEILPYADRSPLIQFLLDCNLDGIKEKRLSWINTAEDITPTLLVKTIQKGTDALIHKWGISTTVAEALSKLQRSKLMKLESLALGHRVNIYLNVAHAKDPAEFRPLEKLSTGQQCTAILHMLLIENEDPLLMDQPEDNLDNAFIAERIVAELRTAKMTRQFIFATHNANIPVFGDAEWIGVFSPKQSQGILGYNSQGSIDIPAIRDSVACILEGGKEAFIQRKEKYEF